MKKAYQQGETEFEDPEEQEDNGDDYAASPRNVGHNIYILAHQVWALSLIHAHKHMHTATHTRTHSFSLKDVVKKLLSQ